MCTLALDVGEDQAHVFRGKAFLNPGTLVGGGVGRARSWYQTNK